MKKQLLFSFVFFLCFQNVMARKVFVTSASDNVAAPTSGMLRYYVENAQSSDTIYFNVSTVNLLGELRITSSVVIDGGINKTTIDAGQNSRIFNISSYSSNTRIIINNLKIINGYHTDDFASGGAMYVFATIGTVEVNDCVFYGSEVVASSDGQGGALRNQGGTFRNCAFVNNQVSGAAGPQGGGGVYAVGGLYINCVFSGNEAKFGGGAYGTVNAKFYNCTFTNNQATSTNSSAAGGIQSEGAEFVNCISYNNFKNGSVSNIDAADNSVISHCAIESSNSLTGSNGNIGLTSSPFKGGNDADSLSLVDGPCVDAGTSTGITVLNRDFVGNNRIAGNAIDLGAYEFNSSPVSGVFIATNRKAVQLYPNPSKGTVYFTSGVLESDNFEVAVYDLLGNIIIKQSNSDSPITIDHPGIYQVAINSNGSMYYQKIVIE